MTLPPDHLRRWTAFTGAAFLVLTAGAAIASAPSARRPVPARLPAPAPALASQAARAALARTTVSAPAAGGGLVAFIDPETGLLAGPAGRLEPPADLFAPIVVLEQVPLPGGGWMMDLKGTGLEHVVLHLDDFGGSSVSCVQHPRHATPRPPAPAGPRAQER